MKKSILALSLFIAFTVSAQKTVHFKIDHFLGSNAFAFTTATSNNLGNAFNVTRLEYYISQIILVHDGGQETPVSKWILVNAGTAVDESLGTYTITTLEAVKFAVGVESAVNHLDPASYPSTHPLAPKSPSMHWGWSSGYRFAAMEGQSGASMNQNYEIHALGDGNYFKVTLPTAGTTSGSDLNIEIDADYEKSLRNINVSNGLIVHGETGGAKDLLRNFAYYVFTSTEGNATIGTKEISLNQKQFSFYPNPSTKNVTLTFESETLNGLGFTVVDAFGRTIDKGEITSNNQLFSFEKSGLYSINITSNGKFLSSEKIIITK